MITKRKYQLGDVVVHASYFDVTKPTRYKKDKDGKFIEDMKGEFMEDKDGKFIEYVAYHESQNTPTMLIVEIQYDNSEKKVLYDTLSGNQVAERMKYKCIWFSQSHFEFTEEWFYESHLILKKSNDNTNIVERIKDFKFSDSDSYRVTLKNYEIEKGKNITNFRNSYLPPFMTIIKVEKNNIQDSHIFSADTEGNRIQIKETSTHKVKCKYYNPISNKFSEQWLIPEILQTL